MRRLKRQGFVAIGTTSLLTLGVMIGRVETISAQDPQDRSQPSESVEEAATPYPDISYDHPRRPGYHFTSARNWINDPNGCVHDGEKYHLFFQHNPEGTSWGNMTWGHATSTDLLRWTQLPHAIRPYTIDGNHGTIFSGTAIQDHRDDLQRRGTSKTPTLAAFFTFAHPGRFHQSLACSIDRGRTWRLHDGGRAVIDNQGLYAEDRDPKIFWDGPREQWALVLYVKKKPGTLRFFSSENLTDWVATGDYQADWIHECPDIFELQVDGDGETKQVLTDASGDYVVGYYNGETFIAETEVRDFNGGGDLYAGQVFNNHPRFEKIGIAWLRNAPPVDDVGNVPFRGQMSFPTRYRLVSTDAGPQMAVQPIAAITQLVVGETRFGPLHLDVERTVDVPVGVQRDADLTVQFNDTAKIEFTFAGLSFEWRRDGRLVVARGDRWVTLIENLPIDANGRSTCRIMVDRMSVEAFGDRGRLYNAVYAMPDLDATPMVFRPGRVDDNANRDGDASTTEAVVDGVVREISGIW